MEKVETLNVNNQLKPNYAIEKKQKTRSIVGSIAGVSIGFLASVALSRKGQPIKDVFVKNDFSKSMKNLYDYTKVDYEGLKGFTSMVMQAGGAALGSLIGGLSVYKNIESTSEEKIQQEKDKKAKIKEALFMTNNVLVPTAFVKTGEWALDKLKEANSGSVKSFASSKITRALMIIVGLVGGMMTSLSVTNTINNKFIEKNESQNKKMRPLDFIYHVDDIIPILVSSKNPICAKFPIDRALPLIYGFMGCEVGQKTKQDLGHSH